MIVESFMDKQLTMLLNTFSLPQVTVHYDQKDGAVIPKRVHTIVISVQHDDCISLEEQKAVLKEKVADVLTSDPRSRSPTQSLTWH